MTRKTAMLALPLALVAIVSLATTTAAFQSGMPDCARADRPCEGGSRARPGCSCHGGLLPPNTTTTVFLDGLPKAGYEAGRTYRITVNVFGVMVPLPGVTGCAFRGLPPLYALENQAGFNLEVSGGFLSEIDDADPALTVLNETECQRLKRLTGCGTPLIGPCPSCDDVRLASSQAMHTLAGNKQYSWQVDWTAPAPAAGDVTLHLAGNVVNGNCHPDPGDLWSLSGPIVVPPAVE